jgi:hypothetical protein
MRENRLHRELQFHLDQLVASYVQQGMSEAEATRKARLEFGGMQQAIEECRDARGTLWLDSTLQDIRLSSRSRQVSFPLCGDPEPILSRRCVANSYLAAALRFQTSQARSKPSWGAVFLASSGSK